MTQRQSILVYRGFARAPGWCHVVHGVDEQGAKAVLVGELDDNPGTSVTNAIEEVAESVKREMLGGDGDFAVFEYAPKGMPGLRPTFYRVSWEGQPGHFSMPEWNVVEPGSDPWLRRWRDLVMEKGYTSKALIAERGLEVLDARAREDLPVAS